MGTIMKLKTVNASSARRKKKIILKDFDPKYWSFYPYHIRTSDGKRINDAQIVLLKKTDPAGAKEFKKCCPRCNVLMVADTSSRGIEKPGCSCIIHVPCSQWSQ